MTDARENADYFQVTLRAHVVAVGIEIVECIRYRQAGIAGAPPVKAQPAFDLRLGPADKSILEQADRVVTDRPAHRILKIEHARQWCADHQIAWHEISM